MADQLQVKSHEFEQTKKLLKDVMTKQAGSIEKAYLEAVMNAVDAGADNIEFFITEHNTQIHDDGSGMTPDEVERNFRVFGQYYGEDEDKDFGKFRMGRGQLFSFGVNVWRTGENVMVVDLKGRDQTVHVSGEDVTVETGETGFAHVTGASPTDGCEITVEHFNPLESVTNTVSELKKMVYYIPFVFDVSISINGDEVGVLVDSEEDVEPNYETDFAYYFLEPEEYSSSVSIYNQGAYVKSQSITRCGGTVVSKKDLELNFARNDVLDICNVWPVIQREYKEFSKRELASASDLTARQRNWLVKEAGDDKELYKMIENRPLLEDVNGKMWSFNSLGGRSLSFSKKGDPLAQQAMNESNAVIINRDQESAVRECVNILSVEDYNDLIDSSMRFEDKKYDPREVSTRQRVNYNRLSWALQEMTPSTRRWFFNGTIEIGYSNVNSMWLDEDGTLVLNKDYLKATKEEFITDILLKAVEHVVASDSTRSGIDEDYSYGDRYHSTMQNLGPIQAEILNSKQSRWK